MLNSLLFACGQPIFPAGWGGAETTAHDLLLALKARGIAVRALGATPRGESSRVRHRLASYFPRQPAFGHSAAYRYDVGYPAECVAEGDFVAALATQLTRERPDVVLTQAIAWPQVAAVARAHGVPSILYVHGAEVLKIGIPACGADRVLYNSNFTRRWLGERFPFPGEVFYPPVDLERHRVTGAGPHGALTLINPLPVKGGQLLVPLARALPDRHFFAVEGWALPPFLAQSFRREPNIEVVAWQHDMREVFSRTAVLLVPSLFEPFGRAPVEVAFSGIPCVSSGVGGLREAIRPDALFVSPEEGLEKWVGTIRELEVEDVYRSHGARDAAWAERFAVDTAASRVLAIAADLVREYRR